MTILNEFGYLEREWKKGFKENIWLVKMTHHDQSYIPIKNIKLPTKYIGKRVKLKLIVEVQE